jgi:hypothetical protein
MPNFSFENQWTQAHAVYNRSINVIAVDQNIPLKREDVLVHGKKIASHLKKIDKSKRIFDFFKAQNSFLNSGEVAKVTTHTDKIQDAVSLSLKNAKRQMAWHDSECAPRFLKEALLNIVSEVEKKANQLRNAQNSKQIVANVRLLSAADVRSYSNVDAKQLSGFVVEVKMGLPDKMHDELVIGNEGLSLAIIQEKAEEVVAVYSAKALTEVEFMHLNALEWRGLEAEANVNLVRITNEAGDACVTAIVEQWNQYAKGRKELTKLKLRCYKKIGLGVLSLGASMGTAVASWGTAAPVYLKIVKEIVGIALALKKLAQEADPLAVALHSRIERLKKELEDGIADNPTNTARELLSSLGMPFLKSCGAAEQERLELSGKTQAVLEKARELTEKLNKGLQQVDHMEAMLAILTSKQDKMKKQLVSVRVCNSNLIEKASAVVRAHTGHMALVKESGVCIEAYKTAQGHKSNIKTLKASTKNQQLVSELHSAAVNMLTLVKDLA